MLSEFKFQGLWSISILQKAKNYFRICLTFKTNDIAHSKRAMSCQTMILFLILCEILLMPGNAYRKHSSDCPCGVRKYKDELRELIIDGVPVRNMSKYPWIVTIHDKDHEPTPWGHCGGALISRTFVLTAAHCLMSHTASLSCLRNILGEDCIISAKNLKIGLMGKSKKEPAAKVAVKKIIPHPRYQKLTARDDIALVQLKKPIKCNKYNMPICVPAKDFVKEEKELVIAGFGRINSDNIESSKILREGKVWKVKPEHCLKPSLKEKHLFCTVGSKYSSCQGDSGTSVFKKKGKRFYTLGVTSTHASIPRCSPSSPVTFSSVPGYYKFIKHYVKDLPDPKGD